MIRKTVKQGIIWFSNMQIRYFKDLCEPCLNAPEFDIEVTRLGALTPVHNLAEIGFRKETVLHFF